MKENGIRFEKDLIAPGLFTYESGFQAAEKLLALKNRPTAIFASNDDMAAATLAYAGSISLRVPADLSVVGFDDSPLAAAVFPRLTTVRQPLGRMAAASVESLLMLISRGGTKSMPPRLILDYSIIHGESTDAPPL